MFKPYGKIINQTSARKGAAGGVRCEGKGAEFNCEVRRADLVWSRNGTHPGPMGKQVDTQTVKPKHLGNPAK